MLDLNFVRANLEIVEEKLRARGVDPAALLGDFRTLDQARRKAITNTEQAKARLNQLSQEVGALKKTGLDTSSKMEDIRKVKEELDGRGTITLALEVGFRDLLARIPNLTRDEVPIGKSEADNVTIKTWGEKPSFDFEPKPHWELGKALGILDLERAAKLSGARFAVYMGAGARLERALASFMLDMHTEKHCYTEVLPPFLVNSKSMFGTGQLPKFEEDLFKVESSGLEQDPDRIPRIGLSVYVQGHE
jgi:seryl-tRNA synthetase